MLGEATNDRELLFALLANQQGLLDRERLAELVALAASDSEAKLALLAVEKGFIAQAEADDCLKLTEVWLQEHDGDLGRSLAALDRSNLEDTLTSIAT